MYGGEALEGVLLQLQQRSRHGAAAVLVLLVALVGGDRRFLVLGQFLDVLVGVRIDEAIDDLVDAHLVGGDPAGRLEDLGDRRRAGGNRLDHVLQAVLDALGDFDLALAGQQFDRSHLAHVHAHRVGGAAELGIDRGQRLFRFQLDFLFIDGGGRLLGQQQILAGRRLVEDLDVHVVERRDDRLDLLGIHHVIGQVVVDFGVGQVAAFLAQRDQGLEARALGFDIERQCLGGRHQLFLAAPAADLGRFRLGRPRLRRAGRLSGGRKGLGGFLRHGLGRRFGGFLAGLGWRQFCLRLLFRGFLGHQCSLQHRQGDVRTSPRVRN